jgi:hypothetical protein
MLRMPFGLILAGSMGLACLLCPANLSAQPWGWHGRTSLVFGAGYYSPYLWHSFWYPYWSPYGPYPYYPYRWRYDDTGAVRLDVRPRNAQVYVDGYFVGVVDDFDGVFQRLRLPPGGHEIALYQEGYRTGRQNVYVSPRTTLRLRLRMAPLQPGEAHEPPPAPKAPPEGARPEETVAPRRDPRLGTLALTIEPSDAEVRVDGADWRRAAEENGFRIDLPEGIHRIEVRRRGYGRFAADVEVRRGETTTLAVSLPRAGPEM